MGRGFIALALTCITASALASPVPTVTPGKIVTFKDWSVGCDNGLACQAVALIQDGMPGEWLSIAANRSEGVNGALIIELAGSSTQSDRFRILIDNRVADTGTIQAGSDAIKVTGADAMKLARAMARGKSLRLVDGAGVDLGGASLAGANAAFRYMDASQGRAGSKGAIVATGRKAATARKATLPVITAKKIVPSDQLPDASALVALSEGSPCAIDRFGSTQDIAYSLGSGANEAQALVLVNCGAGAYNEASGAYIGQRGATGKWTFAPARFDYVATSIGETLKVPVLTNADWDGTTQSLGSYNKARGVGDCGSSENWVWDGSMFRLTGATAMEECRGSLDWIPVWRAEVRLLP